MLNQQNIYAMNNYLRDNKMIVVCQPEEQS